MRKAGNRIRINAQLIDGATGKHLWADRFDRDLTDIFEIQDEISKAIVDALKVKLLPAEKKAIETPRDVNVEAYNLYLMARQQWISGTFGDRPPREVDCARFASRRLALDPDYAQAWALMGLAQLELRFVHGLDEDALCRRRKTRSRSTRGLPKRIASRRDTSRRRANRGSRAARSATALKLDPKSWEVNREVARMLFRHGHVREAIPYFEKAASLNDTDWHNPLMLITCYEAVGDQANFLKAAGMARERVQRAITMDPTNGTALATGAHALAALGDRDRAREWMRRALLLDPDNLVMRYNCACTVLRRFADKEDALHMLEPFFQTVTSTTWIWHAEADPDLEPIREHARFKKMIASARKRLGMADAAEPNEQPLPQQQ